MSAADWLRAAVRRRAERSAELYEELSVAYSVSNNPDTEEAFRSLAEDGQRHAQGLPSADVPRAAIPPEWEEPYPALSDPDAVHYLMPPWHAFDLAAKHEGKLLAQIEGVAADPALASAAAELAGLQRARLDAILARRDAIPKPPPGWWVDEDGPNWDSEF